LYNGYTVAIVNVEHILAQNFYWEGNPVQGEPNDKYIKEQKMRTFLRQVFEGKKAPGGDGYLAFVLLVGDNQDGNNFMPTSYDHTVHVDLPGVPTDLFASDYYFSCVKRVGGTYTEDGQLFIGRFSVEDEEQLYNMVNKTINHETKFDGGDVWRKSAGFTNIAGCSSQPVFYNFISNLLDDTEWNYEIVNGASTPIRIPTLAYWNEGVVYTGYTAQTGGYTSWGDLLNMNAIELGLHNDYMTPFIMSSANPTGRFDKGFTCFGEFMTRYHPTRGAVGYVGASRETYCNHSNPVVIGKLYLHESFAYYLLGEDRSIVGDLMLQSQMNSVSHIPSPNKEKQIKYAYNLFGDPALNILAKEDCKILSGLLMKNIVINDGECYTIPENEELYVASVYSITIMPGGLLMIENNAKVTSAYSQHDPQRFINIQGGTVEIRNNVVIENISFQTTVSISGVQFNNVNYTRHKAGNLAFNMNNCHFTNSSIWLNNHNNNATVTNCTFTDTKLSLQSTISDFPIVMKFDNSEFVG
jgi:hypothetical protein